MYTTTTTAEELTETYMKLTEEERKEFWQMLTASVSDAE